MGVYIRPQVVTKETDLSQITTVTSTTTFAMVIDTAKGPVGPNYVTDQQTFISMYGKPNPQQSLSSYAVISILKSGAPIWVNRVVNGSTYSILKLTATNSAVATADAIGDPTAYSFGEGEVLVFYPIGPGSGYSDIAVSVTNVSEDGRDFTVVVYNTVNLNVPIESWDVSLDFKTSRSGTQMEVETYINAVSDYIRVFTNPANSEVTKLTAPAGAASKVAFAAGSDGTAVGDSQIVEGWQVFNNTKKYSDINTLVNGGYTTVAVQQAMSGVATTRGDSVSILDIPQLQAKATEAVEYRSSTNITNSYCAFYTPYYKYYDRWNDRTLYVPPSGGVAAVYAYTDDNTEQWFAPAGVTRGVISEAQDVAEDYTDSELDLLYSNQINPIVKDPQYGIMVWGQKTTQPFTSVLSHVNVRRLVNTIEKSAATAAKVLLFEFNDEITRRRLKGMMDEFLEDIQGRRGLYAFNVVCNETNNTSYVIANSQMICDITLQPTIAAEVIILNFILTNTGADVTELVTNV